MAKKTNKTSHVMDLLTNGASGEASEPVEAGAASPEAAAGQEKKGDVQSHTVSPKKVTVVDEGSRNDRLSQEILNKLSEELEADTGLSAQDSAKELAASEASAAPETSSVAEVSPGEAPAGEAAPVSPVPETSAPVEAAAPEGLDMAGEEVSVPEASAPASDQGTAGAAAARDTSVDNAPASGKVTPQSIIPKSQLRERFTGDDHHFVNVMELLLLRQDLDSYLEQYNVCKCDRCMADVCALVLTGLPAKYVVTSKDSVSPILGYYESKYKIYMLTELIKACNKVREHPRH